MEEDQQTIAPDKINSGTKYGVIVSIIIAAWLIGLSILGAGLIIAKELAKQATGTQPKVDPEISLPINLTISDDKPRLGPTDSKVTIVEFADFQCPFCGQWHSEIYPKLKTEYIDTNKVSFVYWDLAFLGEESGLAAEAALCAKDQDKFWEYHDKLFTNQSGENQGAFSRVNLKKFAQELGIDGKVFNNCVDARIYKPIVEESTSQASSYGVASTPTVFVKGKKIEGMIPWENYKQIIEAELAK